MCNNKTEAQSKLKANEPISLASAIGSLVISAQETFEKCIDSSAVSAVWPFYDETVARELTHVYRWFFPSTEQTTCSLQEIQAFFADKKILVVGGQEGFIFATLGAKEVIICDPGLKATAPLPDNLKVVTEDIAACYQHFADFDLVFVKRFIDTGNPVLSKFLPTVENLIACMVKTVKPNGVVVSVNNSDSDSFLGRGLMTLEDLHGDRYQVQCTKVTRSNGIEEDITILHNPEKLEPSVSQELPTTKEAGEYVKKRIYYLYPLVRAVYNAFFDFGYDQLARSVAPNDYESGVDLISARTRAMEEFEISLRSLTLYYARVFENPKHFDQERENALIDRLLNTIRMTLKLKYKYNDNLIEVMKNILQRYKTSTLTCSDGETSHHFFGSIPTADFVHSMLPGHESGYRMGASKGFLSYSNYVEHLNIEVAKLVEYIKQHRDNKHVLIWSNNTRGIFDTAYLCSQLLKAGVPTSLKFYRMSPHASGDKEVVIATTVPDWARDAWNIAVDSMTAGGDSVTGSARFFAKFSQKTSMFITYLGSNWQGTYPFEIVLNPSSDLV